jgi:hypothetical protein
MSINQLKIDFDNRSLLIVCEEWNDNIQDYYLIEALFEDVEKLVVENLNLELLDDNSISSFKLKKQIIYHSL